MLKNKFNESKKDKKIKNVVKKEIPTPKKRPNKIPVKKPNSGIKIIKVNILI